MANKELKKRRFWATYINRKWAFWILGQRFLVIISIIVNTLSNTSLVASRHMKMEMTSLPVDVRRSPTLVLKLPDSSLSRWGQMNTTTKQSHITLCLFSSFTLFKFLFIGLRDLVYLNTNVTNYSSPHMTPSLFVRLSSAGRPARCLSTDDQCTRMRYCAFPVLHILWSLPTPTICRR